MKNPGRMKISGLRLWMRLVLCYWLVVSVVVALEIAYMKTDWAGLPGAVLALPLSVLVITGYVVASYVREIGWYDIYAVNVYHVEYGFLVCAFLNAFIFYPFYWWWTARRRSRQELEPPPPPSLSL